MATNTKTIKANTRKAATSKAKTAKAKITGKRAPRSTGVDASDAIVRKKITGINGYGLVRLGNKSALELRDRLAMPRQMFSRVVNVSERTIAEAETGKPAAEKLKRPYNEVYRLFQALSEVVDAESLGLWFQTPNDAFEGLKPVEVIERGEIDRLWNMVFQLRSGMPA